MDLQFSRLEKCYETAKSALLAERNDDGHWEGELSTSALSTATAVMALEMVQRDGGGSFPQEIAAGIKWLAEHQNPDGGWGDTTKSLSNISTTMLCRAVFHATGTEAQYHLVVRKAIVGINRKGGVPAVIARYGKDKTFSIPILTHCALAGLVDWKDVQPLPFELACLPAKFYKAVKLPVVSYALPALIAIGQVRHHHKKTWNPITRFLRWLAKKPSLKVLQKIQPENGGFLEAAPLTSFVTMSLAGMGLSDHPVAKKGVEFLLNSIRPDGSWPIDTNLATWTTTLAVNALGDDLPKEDRPAIRDWLLEQQYKTLHPYTNADPGGWAWTNLPGGVPDADDTPGAMLALIQLNENDKEHHPPSRRLVVGPPHPNPLPHGERGQSLAHRDVSEAIGNGIGWLIKLQNRDGGFPTFCKGWGTLPFDRSAPDLTAHCIRAIQAIVKLRHDYVIEVGKGMNIDCPDEVFDLATHVVAGSRYLQKQQREDGSWLPLWFGNQHAPDDINPTYGTARVLAAYRDLEAFANPAALRGVKWLKENQNPDGGWGGVKGTPSSVEETALAVEILLSFDPDGEQTCRGIEWLMERVEDGSYREPTPIGFYFAKLWYFERLYPLIFTVAALRRAVQTKSPDRKPASKSQQDPTETSPKARTPRIMKT